MLKDIKNVHLSVYPPTGRVRISAPQRMSLDTIRVFAISKLGWIRQQQTKLREQERETPREYLDRESHYVWGKRYLLTVRETTGPVWRSSRDAYCSTSAATSQEATGSGRGMVSRAAQGSRGLARGAVGAAAGRGCSGSSCSG